MFRKGLIERSLRSDNIDNAKIGIKFLEKVDDRFKDEGGGEFVQRVIFETADGMEIRNNIRGKDDKKQKEVKIDIAKDKKKRRDKVEDII